MKTLPVALLALLFCTFSGFAEDYSPVAVGRTYQFYVVDNASINAKVVKLVSNNWIVIEYNDNQTRMLNLQTVITIKDLTGVKKP